jgi:hypothetical protein
MHSHARTSTKIDTTLFYVAVFFVLFLSPEIARRSSQKKFEPRITRIARMMRMTKMRGPRMHAKKSTKRKSCPQCYSVAGGHLR